MGLGDEIFFFFIYNFKISLASEEFWLKEVIRFRFDCLFMIILSQTSISYCQQTFLSSYVMVAPLPSDAVSCILR